MGDENKKWVLSLQTQANHFAINNFKNLKVQKTISFTQAKKGKLTQLLNTFNFRFEVNNHTKEDEEKV